MSYVPSKRDAWHRSLGESTEPAAGDEATVRGLALAGRDGHAMETLYSIDRAGR